MKSKSVMVALAGMAIGTALLGPSVVSAQTTTQEHTPTLR